MPMEISLPWTISREPWLLIHRNRKLNPDISYTIPTTTPTRNAIIGGTVGGVSGLSLLVLFFYFKYTKKGKQQWNQITQYYGKNLQHKYVPKSVYMAVYKVMSSGGTK
jgi:hypothetical protein